LMMAMTSFIAPLPLVTPNTTQRPCQFSDRVWDGVEYGVSDAPGR
jgi:hypothetical protein